MPNVSTGKVAAWEILIYSGNITFSYKMQIFFKKSSWSALICLILINCILTDFSWMIIAIYTSDKIRVGKIKVLMYIRVRTSHVEPWTSWTSWTPCIPWTSYQHYVLRSSVLLVANIRWRFWADDIHKRSYILHLTRRSAGDDLEQQWPGWCHWSYVSVPNGVLDGVPGELIPEICVEM